MEGMTEAEKRTEPIHQLTFTSRAPCSPQGVHTRRDGDRMVSTDDVPTGTQGLFREGVSQFTEVSRPSVPQCVTQDGRQQNRELLLAKCKSSVVAH